MNWKKVAESEDLIVFEKMLKDSKLKIEARKTDELNWEVFKTQIKGESSNLVSEYVLNSKKQVKDLIKTLKNEDPESRNTASSISMTRVYKEDFVEKWNFRVDNQKLNNFLIIKYDDTISVDVILCEKYAPSQRSIISQIEEKLGLKQLGESINYNLYYYKKHTSHQEHPQSDNEYNINFLDVEFDPSDNY